MDTEAARRYARQIALSDVGPDGQERICRARVAVVGGDLSADIAALYLAAAGVGRVIRLRATERDAADWMAALTEIDLVVRAGFDDDAMAAAASRLGIPVVVMRALADRVDLVSFPRRVPAADAHLEVPAQAAAPGSGGAEEVVAGTLAAAEALVSLANPAARGGVVRHLRFPFDGSDPMAQTIGASSTGNLGR
jgi:hypothetical protein